MRTDLNIGLLRTFLTIVECEGFARASQKLCLTQSAVSRQLSKLESSLE